MTNRDVFALQHSAFNTFLFADVGTEMNGSTLTMLSVLSRQGEDPWTQAARWSALPRAAVIDSVAACIAGMPLVPAALAEVRLTAARLALLLPGQTGATRVAATAAGPPHVMPKPVHVIALCAALMCAIVVSVVLQPRDVVAGHPAAAGAARSASPIPGE